MRTSVTTEERNALRRLAVGLLGNGVTLADTAEALEVSLSSVKRWKKTFRQGGETALEVKRPPGARSRLSNGQRDRLRQMVIADPLAAGFATDLWTCARVALVIQREFGVSYHPDHVGRVLRALGFTPQKPQRRARERDEAAIERWRREDWPRIKKGRRRQATIVFLDETGFVLQPLNRRTWALRGSRSRQVVSQRRRKGRKTKSRGLISRGFRR